MGDEEKCEPEIGPRSVSETDPETRPLRPCEEAAMLLVLLQIVAVAGAAAYLHRTRVRLRRLNTQTWESLLARLRPGWNEDSLCEVCSLEHRRHESLRRKWQRAIGARGLWAMYSNAGVMLEMACYAERNSDSLSRELLEQFRRDALFIRACVVKTLVRYAVSSAYDSICMSALRAESAYAEMMLHLTGILEAKATSLVPGFVAAC